MIAAGDKGDMDARACAASIAEWSHSADKALKAGMGPECGRCRKCLGYGDVGGWAIMRPKEGSGTGLVMAYCKRCIMRPRQELVDLFTDAVSQEFGLMCMSLQ